MKRIGLLFTISLILSGCVKDYTPIGPPPLDPSTTKMAEAAASVSSSLQTLEAIKKTQHPRYIKKLPDPRGFCMPRLASVEWTGPIGPLVKKIAEASNFRLRVLGNPPPIPVIIAINAKNLTLGEIIRDVDYQAAYKANIIVYPASRTIELRYTKY